MKAVVAAHGETTVANLSRSYIGLGSNLDQPVDQLTEALVELSAQAHTQVIAQSSLYRSAPVGPQDQPDFVNAVALLETRLSPIELLDFLQSIEQAHQRKRIQHWGPRTLDLDILLFNNEVINQPRLSVPHPFMKERGFVLQPLFEIDPQCALPCGTSVDELIKQCDVSDLVRLS